MTTEKNAALTATQAPSEDAALDVKRIGAWFSKQLAPYKRLLASIVALMAVQLAFTLTTPMAMQLVFDTIIPNGDFGLLLALTVVLATAFTIGLLGKVVLDRQVGRIVSRVVFELSRRLFHKVTRLPSTTRRPLSNGDLLARFTSDVTQVEQALQVDVPGLVQHLLLLVGCLAAALYIEWRLTLVALLAAPVALLGAQWISPKIATASTRHKQHQARLAEIVEQGLGAHLVVRTFGLERFMDGWFEGEGRKVEHWGRKVSYLSLLMGGFAYYGVMFLLASVMLTGAALTLLGMQSVGALMACLLLLVEVGNAVAVVSLHLASLIRIAGAIGRLRELDALPYEEDQDTPITLPALTNGIAFQNIRFAYDGHTPVLDDLSMVLPAGQYCALIGGSGSGKSTVLRLVMGLERAQAGTLLWDATPLTTFNAAAAREHMGFVPQEPLLFDLTIRENIRLGRAAATDAEIEAAARAAEIHEAVSALPEGYETRAGGGGGNLSGGQRQRIAIARALIRNPAILVLDEATSALDTRTEAEINRTIRKLSRDRMVINVTHRIDSIQDADRIFVLDHGRLLAEGTHASLSQDCDRYRDLCRKQSGFIATEDGMTRVNAERLRQIPLFHNLSDAWLERLSGLFFSQDFAAGEVILREGQSGERFLLIARGQVEVEASGVTVACMEGGDFFGEIALLGNRQVTATCTAKRPTTCLVLSRQHFIEHILSHDDVRQLLEQKMAERLAANAERLSGADS